MVPHVIAINGIRTPTTADSWPKRLLPFLEGRYRCTGESHYYRTGPLPPWNLWVVNPRIAKTLASSVEARMDELGPHPIHIVAHSNGTNIALALARELGKRRIRVETMVLIASALHSDVEVSGLEDLIDIGQVRRAVAYCSPDDLVVSRLQAFPGFYGSLGSRGFERAGGMIGLQVQGYDVLEGNWGNDRHRVVTAPAIPGFRRAARPGNWGNDRHRFVTRWFPGYGHSDYFRDEVRRETFDSIARDCRLVPTE